MKKYWKSLEENQEISITGDKAKRPSTVSAAELPDQTISNLSTSRRDFLKVFGYSLSSTALLASCERPIQKAIPYIIQPEEIIPGKAVNYATSFYDGHEYCNIIVKTRDGRPIKIEGNKQSGFNGEGTTARVQASVLSLYDDARLKEPSENNVIQAWDTIDKKIKEEFLLIQGEAGKVVLMTPTIISPTTKAVIKKFGDSFKNFKWIQYDAISYSAIIEANQKSFGMAVIPDYNFQKADFVVSLNSDFLGTWLTPVHFIPRYASRRKPGNGQNSMLRHVQFESGMSLTGSNADLRKTIKPSEELPLLINLYNGIAKKTGGNEIPATQYKEDISWLVNDLIECKGKSIVISGTNNVSVQIITNGINSLLGNYNECIDIHNTLNIAAGIDSEMGNLIEEMNSESVKALLMYNVNPVYDYPLPEKFLSGLKKIKLTINMAVSLNETVGKSLYECPVNHFLESWDDSEIISGQLGLSQVCINPLFNTRSFQDSLLIWSGNSIQYQDFLKANWESSYFPSSKNEDFNFFWNNSLKNGVYNYEVSENRQFGFNADSLSNLRIPEKLAEEFEVLLVASVALGNGMHANNPWLMELPDPVTRLCWDNVVSVSVRDAEKLGIQTGNLINLGNGKPIPAYIQPGQADGTFSIALGYGHTNSGKVSDNIGINVYPHIRLENGNRIYDFVTKDVVISHEITQLALIQTHNSMEGRAIVRETTLDEFNKNPHSGNEMHVEHESKHRTLYPELKFDGFHWGLCVDLNSCIGCNTCVIACQAENNIPVIGKLEVSRRRIMHWIKIDRYYAGNPNEPEVLFQPVMCQHCDNAPCENVCPVSATNHSNEGLNQMTYNRCIGTKYCINNCPYKVRRFNWFRYTNNKEFDFNAVSDLGKLVLNPDVTVRERGVVEKCTFCVQRIQDKKLQAKLENRTLKDGEIKTACMQACPSNAIIFGNLNDKESMVSGLFEDPRCYHLLEELHTLPSLGYLTKVRNKENNLIG